MPSRTRTTGRRVVTRPILTFIQRLTFRTAILSVMNPLHAWLQQVQDELGCDLDLDADLILDLTRDVAHGVERAAAPLTAFLVGYAAGESGGGADAVRVATERVTALVEQASDPT